jgi:hypothetical protein
VRDVGKGARMLGGLRFRKVEKRGAFYFLPLEYPRPVPGAAMQKALRFSTLLKLYGNYRPPLPHPAGIVTLISGIRNTGCSSIGGDRTCFPDT